LERNNSTTDLFGCNLSEIDGDLRGTDTDANPVDSTDVLDKLHDRKIYRPTINMATFCDAEEMELPITQMTEAT
jgi:hypothetical protein